MSLVVKMEGILLNFRHSSNNYYHRQAIIKVGENASKIFYQLIGRKAIWIHPKTGQKFIGKIVKLHGRKYVIAYFRKQPPCQAIGSTIQII